MYAQYHLGKKKYFEHVCLKIAICHQIWLTKEVVVDCSNVFSPKKNEMQVIPKKILLEL
jgi:AMMECR1 domain-containing protein